MRTIASAPVRALLALMTLPFVVGGCAGSLFKTQVAPPTMYLLSADAPPEAGAAHSGAAPGSAAPASAASPGRAASGSAAQPQLAVLKPRVRTGLDTERIAALYPDRHLDYFADARWSGPLDEVIEDLAVQLLHSRAGLADVSGDASAFASTYWLEIEVADFQAEYAVNDAAGGAAGGAVPPTARVHLLARIGSSGDRTIIARCEAEALQPASSNRMSAIVAAYNRAANQALLKIAASCTATLAPAEPQVH